MKQRWLRTITLLTILFGFTLVLATCAPRLNLQERVRTVGTLRVALINSATTYFMRGKGTVGFEYDLVRRFVDHLGLKLKVIGVDNRHAAIAAIKNGQAHMVAGLAISHSARQQVHFTPPYSKVNLDIVYNTHDPKPENLEDISGKLTIRAHSALSESLKRLHPDLTFQTRVATNAEALMAAVAKGKIYSTIASDDLVAINQRYYPELRVAFTLPKAQRKLAWAFPKHGSETIYNRAVAWLAQAKQSGQIHILRQRYFAHADRLGFVGGRIFAEQVRQRLPKWRPLFKNAGTEYSLDWRLLAAMSYQESHWDPDATSPTGVRGLMMLTQATASDLGVSNRLDPTQSINGGARYLVRQRKRLPNSIKEPDRTWMAMAAYNIGFGHLMDARRLVAKYGKNPNLWANVRTALTWLTQEQYFDETRYGYAPGYQAVEYVGNIRAYYDILHWITLNNADTLPETLARARAPHPASRHANPDMRDIRIDSPAL